MYHFIPTFHMVTRSQKIWSAMYVLYIFSFVFTQGPVQCQMPVYFPNLTMRVL